MAIGGQIKRFGGREIGFSGQIERFGGKIIAIGGQVKRFRKNKSASAGR